MDDPFKVGKTFYERAVMLDTGPLISLYDPKDSRGERIDKALQELQLLRYPVCITFLTIAETHRRILYDVGRKRALDFLKAIYDGSVRILEAEEDDITVAISIIEKYSDQEITYTDAMSMAVMKREAIRTVLSYDHHFWLLNFSVLTGDCPISH